MAVPLWALGLLTWLNSLGSGLLWTGAFFVTEHQYGFTKRENLLLALVASLVYIPAALLSSRLVQRGKPSIGTRGVLGCVLVLQAAGAMCAIGGSLGLVVSVIFVSAVSALLWPIVEVYVSSGRHGHAMRAAIGFFNIAWMSAVAICLVVIAPFVGHSTGEWAIAAFAPVSLLSIIVLAWFPRDPAPHSTEATDHVPASYPSLLRATRYLLPICYIFIGALGPLLPFLLEDRGVDPSWQTAFAATWMWARVGSVVVFRHLTIWHGRWSALWLGVVALAGGFALILSTNSVPLMALGFVAFGVGQGLLYYASLYYAMAVGGAQVDAGGKFESLIGLGYALGPSAALIGDSLGSSGWVIACVWILAGVAISPAIRIWWGTRTQRGR